MVRRTSYAITVVSGEVDDYDTDAGLLLNALQLFVDADELRSICRNRSLTNAHTTVSIAPHTDGCLVATATLDVEAGRGKCSFDKNRFSTLVREQLPFPIVRISKREVV